MSRQEFWWRELYQASEAIAIVVRREEDDKDDDVVLREEHVDGDGV